MATYQVMAHWDHDAGIWWAESSDIPGIVAEADTHDALVRELRSLIPEALQANRPEVDLKSSKFRLLSDQIEEVCYA